MTTDSCSADWAEADPARTAATLALDGVHLWLLSLDVPPRPLQELAASLDADERARAARFHFPILRRRFEAAHGLLRHVLAGYLQRAPSELRFSYTTEGKPSLADRAASECLQFNLSHSGGAALLGLTRGRPIGVDLEMVRPLPERDAIARSNFAPQETAALDAMPEERRLDGFFACWTCKEAVIKALGGGLSIPLERFEVDVDPGRPAALLSLHGSTEAARGWSLWRDRPFPGAWSAVAVPAGPLALQRHRLAETLAPGGVAAEAGS